MLEKLTLFIKRLVIYLDMRRLLFWVLLPLIIAGGAIGIAELMDTDRWEADYFTPAYRELYGNPRDTMSLAAEAIMADDQNQLLALQANSDAEAIAARSRLAYLFPYAYYTGYRRHVVYDNPNSWEQMEAPNVRFAEYLYADRETREMLVFTVEQVNGRWVFVPDSAYLYMQKGGWWRLWRAATLIYTIALILRVGWLYIERNNEAQRLARIAARDRERERQSSR